MEINKWTYFEVIWISEYLNNDDGIAVIIGAMPSRLRRKKHSTFGMWSKKSGGEFSTLNKWWMWFVLEIRMGLSWKINHAHTHTHTQADRTVWIKWKRSFHERLSRDAVSPNRCRVKVEKTKYFTYKVLSTHYLKCTHSLKIHYAHAPSRYSAASRSTPHDRERKRESTERAHANPSFN